jgi:hypothetical protein
MNAGAAGEITSGSVDTQTLNFSVAPVCREGAMALKKADFRTFYRDAHAVECLTEREKMLIGLTVAMMRLCDP